MQLLASCIVYAEIVRFAANTKSIMYAAQNLGSNLGSNLSYIRVLVSVLVESLR